MKDLVYIHALLPDQASYFSRIPILFDEPVYSYVTRIMLLAVETDRARIEAQLFGGRRIRLTRSLHAGFEKFAHHVNCLSANACKDVIGEHSMLALFKPFSDPGRYEQAYKVAGGPRGGGMNWLVGLRVNNAIFRAQPAVCLDCVRADQHKHPFAYYRRNHQVSAASHCAVHKAPLITGCSSCGAEFSHWDLPGLICHHCGVQLAPAACNQKTMPDLSARIRLSKVVAAVFAGEIPAIDASLRLAILRGRTEQRVRTRSGVIGDNLATHVLVATAETAGAGIR